MSSLLVQAALNVLLASNVVRAATDADAGIVHTYASLGESFASGPSAGDLTDTQYSACRRYTKAFGPQFNADPDITPKTPKFDFIACSGSKLANIYKDPSKTISGKPPKSQANQLAGQDPDIVTLSIGGNDVGFVNLLDHCVYRFYDVFCQGCGPLHGDCSDDCQKTIDETQATINASPLATDLDNAISEIFKNAPKAHVYLTLYPQFFNWDSDQCNDVQFNVGCAGNVKEAGRSSILPLTNDRRKKMNDLTDSLNNKIKDAVKRAQPPDGAAIDFVDTNPKFDGHRFCEASVTEPSYRNDQIYFYPEEFSTGGTVAYLQQHKNGTDCANILKDEEGGDWGDYYACEIAESLHKHSKDHTSSGLPFPIPKGNSSSNHTIGNLPFPIPKGNVSSNHTFGGLPFPIPRGKVSSNHTISDLPFPKSTGSSDRPTSDLPFLKGDSPNVVPDSSGSDSLPDFLARIFHPTINGHTAYKEAIKEKWSAYAGSIDAPPTQCSAGSCQNGPPGGS